MEFYIETVIHITVYYFCALERRSDFFFLHKHLCIYLVLIMQNPPLGVPSNNLKVAFPEKLGTFSIRS